MDSKKTKKNSLADMFIPNKSDSKQKVIQKLSMLGACAGLIIVIIVVTVILCMSPKTSPVGNNISSMESSSEVSSEEVSSEVSSEEISSEVSSEEVSSEVSSTVSSKATSSKATTSSKAATSSKAVTSSKPQTPTNTSGMPEGYLPKFADWYAANTDVKAHIVIPGTNVNYPVMQAKNNEYYLNHNEYKKSYGWGIPYLDYRVTISPNGNSKNIMMYGHGDDKRGLMLSNMKGYRKVDFYKQHPVITFDTVYEAKQFKVITMFKEDTNPKRGNSVFQFWNAISLNDEASFNNYIDNVKQRAFFTSNVDVNSSDQLLSIQVCEDTNINNYNRLVLVCRAVREGEDPSVDTSGAAQR